ncbi:PhzA/PhzB family protein [Bittarella massiliensis (ex Durand et al. 2017)]|uniref:PhzA/PhzB family protein n=1 Tax=Bittarella massiliensis (ex Durand et al. 2017) TaxID=1720313 RepID=UPI001AA0C0A8|nr:PhzA/PhzB family protein [Bittarella massiliensis (ex Durand et al. 2017)]MBO1678785.1 hypothetical protein [Bittarella massiliensis (ex Durand et al. 2017)]
METTFVCRPYDPADDALRQKNLQAVIGYMTAAGEDRLERWKLFEPSDETTLTLGFAAQQEPVVNRGIRCIRQTNESYVRDFPDWSFQNLVVRLTGDPNIIFVEADGAGTSLKQGTEERASSQHSEHSLHRFICKDGKILHYTEFMNPINELLKLGYQMPY